MKTFAEVSQQNWFVLSMFGLLIAGTGQWLITPYVDAIDQVGEPDKYVEINFYVGVVLAAIGNFLIARIEPKRPADESTRKYKLWPVSVLSLQCVLIVITLIIGWFLPHFWVLYFNSSVPMWEKYAAGGFLAVFLLGATLLVGFLIKNETKS